MTIHVFAGLAEDLGARTLPWPDEGEIQSVEALERALRKCHPELTKAAFRIAVNKRYASWADEVSRLDEVALIPPVSGG